MSDGQSTLPSVLLSLGHPTVVFRAGGTLGDRPRLVVGPVENDSRRCITTQGLIGTSIPRPALDRIPQRHRPVGIARSPTLRRVATTTKPNSNSS